MSFYSQFKAKELITVELETLKGGKDNSICLRGLSRADTSSFRELLHDIRTARALRTITPDTKELQLQRAEDYLLLKALCDPSGVQQFKDADELRDWLEEVPNNIVNEILYHIKTMNTLDGSCPQSEREAAEKEQKKKLNAS